MSEQIVGWRATGREDYPKDGEGFFNGAGEVLVCRGHWLHEAGTRRIAAPVFAGEDAADLAARVRKLEGYFVPDANGEVLNLADFMLSIDMRFAALESAAGERGEPMPDPEPIAKVMTTPMSIAETVGGRVPAGVAGPVTSPSLWRKCPECGTEWDASCAGMCHCHSKPMVIPAPSPVTVHVSTPATAKVEAGESYGERVAKIMLPQAGLIVHPTNPDLVALTTDDAVSRDNARAILGHALNAARADGLAARTVPSRERIEKLATRWQYKAQASRDESSRIRSVLKQPCDAEERCVVRALVWDDCAANLLALLTPEPPHA